MFQIIEQRESRSERIAAESFGIECLVECLARWLKINLPQLLAILLHRLWRKTKGCRCGKALDFARSLKLAPMRGNCLPVVMQFLRIARMHDCYHRLPTDRHFVHDLLKRATGAAVFRFQRTCARLEVKRWDRRKSDCGQQQQEHACENQHGPRVFHAPPHIFFYHLENPIMTEWRLPLANKKK